VFIIRLGALQGVGPLALEPLMLTAGASGMDNENALEKILINLITG